MHGLSIPGFCKKNLILPGKITILNQNILVSLELQAFQKGIIMMIRD